jgi:Holliday junction resolvase-like predicted endonuclease
MDMLIAILNLSRRGPISHEIIKRDTRFPRAYVDELLQRLQNDGLVYVRDNMVETSDAQRLELALRALKAGAGIDKVSNLLHWKEFEAIAALAFEHNCYSIVRNLRFKQGARKYEIDIVGCKKPLVVCADCKHWHHGLHKSTLNRVVEEQIERVRALVKSLPNPKVRLKCVSWNSAKFVPVILSLTKDESKFCAEVPVVPILELQDFLSQLPAYADSLLSFKSVALGQPSSGQNNIL